MLVIIKNKSNKSNFAEKSANPKEERKSLSVGTIEKVSIQNESKEMKRRDFIKLSAIVAGGALAVIALESPLKPLLLAPTISGQLLDGSKRGTVEMDIHPLVVPSLPTVLDPLSIPMFENQLTGPPPVYKPKVITSGGNVIRHEYTVAMSSFQEQILPPSMNLLTSVWGYGGTAIDALTGASLGFVQSSPGPTFEAIRGIPIQVEWQNTISSPYMFAVDPTIHWANPNKISTPTPPFPTYPPGYPNAQSPVLLVTHLHGGENQSYYDGGPNQWFTSDGKKGLQYSTYNSTISNAAIYYYPNAQQPTTLWYHDHGLGVTRLNVMSGLAGFYLIRESKTGTDKVAAMLPTGKYEMPLVIQDRSFNNDGSFYYPSIGIESASHPYWVNSFLGQTIMVNGKVWPNMNVDKGQYRFRVLNGSNSRFYNISFSNGMSFIQIGSDGGYLKSPVTITSLLLAPAERADIIVDFSNLASGAKVILSNSALTTSTSEEKQTMGQIMQFTITNQTGTMPFDIAQAPTPFNPTLSASDFPTLPQPTKKRILTLFEVMGQNNTKVALLDGQMWDAPISEQPAVGTTEDWVIVNPTMNPHPIHLHLIQFQLVQRETFDAPSYTEAWTSLNGNPPFSQPTRNLNLDTYLSNLKIPLQPNEQAWKDTIIVNAGQVVTIRVRFASQDGSNFPFDATAGPGYVWHCHLLEHEDNEMMRPYKVTQKASTVLPLAIALAGVSAAALMIAYYYMRQQKKKQQDHGESIS